MKRLNLSDDAIQICSRDNYPYGIYVEYGRKKRNIAKHSRFYNYMEEIIIDSDGCLLNNDIRVFLTSILTLKQFLIEVI